MTEKLDLQGRVALVTGASRGIGYHVAKELAAAGAHVIAVARTVGGLEELDNEIQAAGGQATLVPLDLMDMSGIDRLGGAIFDRWGKLDILVANAGILGIIAPIGHVEAKVFDKVMATNVTGTWRLIRSVDPLLRKSDAGRAIAMTSDLAVHPRAYWGPFAASKAAVEAMVRSWALETQNSALRVNLVDPGPTRTAHRALAMPGEDPTSIPHPSEIAARIAATVSPKISETGRLFSVRENRFLD
ncbi:SDR family NAD(P)-dependent oxidoreductase [Mesorhizobium sp. YIM 152430]|uniref:SDR family NAD(P)-dependent oxidoreductase n=1 Tax=Mesorhizobium sp. YIM 152430 TaxID=3031761 RepID=UPI0023DCC464|nr:SDR family NAD(P)-dependent oxidoreductase [Mesorhizobium sp. YIM 152430]MDF1600473.1 SDR family NAD(P)-dependent oxidoreductase [Mesorhizobium sp. YIM 152430]